MENTSYALHIAVGVLIAIILISIILFVHSRISFQKQSEDEMLDASNKSAFNEALLVYDKRLMYGADVLSCLNKAQNNNQKYVYNNYYGEDLSDISDRQEYFVNVTVKLKKTLEEKITVYSKNSSGTISPNPNYNLDSSGYRDTFKPFKPTSTREYFNLPVVTYYYFDSNNIERASTAEYADIMWKGVPNSINVNTTLIHNGIYQTSLEGNASGVEYKLIDTGSAASNRMGKLSALLSTITQTEQVINNNNYSDGMYNWYYTTWRTAVYDFKTRKFKCTNVHYNETTGYIDLLEFEEIL